MKGIYILPFSLKGESGKNRASRQKAKALREEVDEVLIVYPKSESLFLRAFEVFFNEMKVVWLLLSRRSKADFVLTRGLSGVFCVPVARLLRIPTLREVHSISIQEAWHIKAGLLKRVFAAVAGILDNAISRASFIRIFNHPNLHDYYRGRNWARSGDFVCYNGGAPEEACDMSKVEAKAHFGLPADKKILVFIGSAAAWHGVDYLVDLANEISKRELDMCIVCGGGDISSLDPSGHIRNITPLDSESASKLIRAADACLLPVKQIRISPGSPLKLYDYVLNDRPVIAQSNMCGYSDEVERLGVGITVDFCDVASAADQVSGFLSGSFQMPDIAYLVDSVAWRSRVRFWLRKAFGDHQ